MLVKNRCAGLVGYDIPDLKISRRFVAGEVKDISKEELDKLAYQPGGLYILQNYLQVSEEDAKILDMHNEPEYYLTEEQIKNLLLNGSMDAFLDALDFAPKGVIDMFKDLAIKLPLTDTNKMKAIKDKTGYDVAKAIEFNLSTQEEAPAAAVPKRRVVKEVEEEATTPQRRVNKEYKVIS